MLKLLKSVETRQIYDYERRQSGPFETHCIWAYILIYTLSQKKTVQTYFFV